MEKIPCLSHWMRFINCLFLDRKNIKAGLATMNEGTKLLKDGFSIAIFPEGTRSQDEDPHEFKEGSLRPALKAGVPVIPMAISGTADILENNRRFQVKPTTVHITLDSQSILISLKELRKSISVLQFVKKLSKCEKT